MDDITIPDAAVEAAARAIAYADQSPYLNADQAEERVMRTIEGYRMLARKGLAAAAPYIAAQALEDLLTDAPPTGRVPHPFHWWREWIAYRALRLREPIEADHG